MKKLLLVLILFAVQPLVFAQNVYISGEGKDIKGKTVKLYSIADDISEKQKEEQVLKLSEEDSTFSFAITLSGERSVVVKIDFMSYSFVTKPGTKYHLQIDNFSLSKEDSLLGLAYGKVLPCSLTMERYDGINLPMFDVDMVLNDFIVDNQRLLFVKDSSTIASLHSLKDSLIEIYKDNDYIKNYVIYSVANVDYAFAIKSRASLKDSLFAHKPILYNNLAYTDCFKNIFSKYFSKGYKYIKRKDIENWLASKNYNAFNDALGRDKVLENEVFREFVFLQGMKDAYLDSYFDRKLVLQMLEQFVGITKFEAHKQIAQNLVDVLSNINAENSDIKDLEVKDIDGQKVPLNKFIKDKPLIVCFIRFDQEISLKEMEGVYFCYDSIKDYCDVLTICCSDNYEKMYNFIKNNKVGNKYKWDFVYFDNNYDIFEKFHVRTFPTFILINPEGKIVKNPMDSPSLGALLTFKKKQQ